jgi:hypothetical protein
VGESRGLRSDFVNEDVLPVLWADFKENETFSAFSFSNLDVRIPTEKQLLAMKLFSARVEGKDLGDAVFLAKKLGISSVFELRELLGKFVKEDSIKKQNRHPNRRHCIDIFIDKVIEVIRNEKAD